MENDKKTDVKTVTKKKKSPLGIFFRTILIFIAAVLALIIAWCAFSLIDKKSSLASIPRNYTVYIHTDSAFDTVNPLLDLQVADVLLSMPEFSKYRKPFMEVRSSFLRENPFVKFALSRPVDMALYDSSDGENFAASINLGIFSAATRLSSLVVPHLNVKGLSVITDENLTCYRYESEGVSIYFKAVKNLLLVSDSAELLLTSSLADNSSLYTKEQLKLLSSSSGKSLTVVANARILAERFTGSDPVLTSMAELISPDSLSVVSLDISDSDIGVKIQLPLEDEENISSTLLPLLKKPSKTPSIISRFSDSVQYYTLLNAGTLEELKAAVFPLLSVSDIDKTWNSANSLCRTAFGISIEDLLFSWTGNEFAAFGLENHNEPVFSMQIKDEKKRREIFEKISSSMFIKEDNSLILNGARLPRLSLPSYLNWILSAFNISIPSPYFLVQDGFIYFSQSPENLSEIYSSSGSGKTLVKKANYEQVSSAQKNENSISLFYDLDKSAPFFIRANKAANAVLSLYPLGRFDARIKNNVIEFQLQSCARKSGNLSSVPGFPVKAGKNASIEDFCFVKQVNSVFWVEDGNTVKKMRLDDLSISSAEFSDDVQIFPVSAEEKEVVLWTVNSRGVIDLLNKDLESTGNFPLMTGEHTSGRASPYENGLYVPLEGGKILSVYTNGTFNFIEIPDLFVKSPVTVSGGKAAVYSKGFLGNIYLIQDGNVENLDNPIQVNGIGIGSPVFWKGSVAFISQAGSVQVWKNGTMADFFPLQLEGVFLTNLRASEKYLYALSSDAVLYRISQDGRVLSVKIPGSTAKEPHFSVQKNGSLYNVYVNADSNVIYGFNENLELLSGYPLPGCSVPVFADVNGDKLDECISLTLDGQIAAWKLR